VPPVLLGRQVIGVGVDDLRHDLDALIDASLVVPMAESGGRLRLLATVRSYACELLAEADEFGSIARRHAVWLLRWARAGAANFESQAQLGWLADIDTEIANVRAALNWSRSEHGDPGLGLDCWLNRFSSFDSASVIKVTILAALLRKAEDQHRHLTATEAAQAKLMITESDNDAASDLWAELGRSYLQHFLDVAAMRHTTLGSGSYWGLTQITANDQVVLLRLLLNANPVLDAASRSYALKLMAEVIPAQRWGVPAGAPADLTVHVKNGWLPLATHGWRIHSIGCFTGHGNSYSIVVLTQDNPTMAYGVDTVEAIAEAVNRDLRLG